MPGPVEFDLKVADSFLGKDVLAADTTMTFGHDSSVSFVNFPAPPFWITIDPDDPSARETVVVTALTGPTATVLRGYDHTSAKDHKRGAPVRFAGQRIGGRWRRSTQTPIASGSQTSINWNIEDEDTDGFLSIASTTITIPAGLGGLYVITAKTEWDSALGAAGAAIRNLVIIVPTSTIANFASQFRNNVDAADALNYAAVTIPLLGGDSFTVDVFQTSGVNHSVTAWLTCYRVGV